jgi:hypothetical protein
LLIWREIFNLLFIPLLGKEGLRGDFKRSSAFKYVDCQEEMIYYFTLIEVFIIV